MNDQLNLWLKENLKLVGIISSGVLTVSLGLGILFVFQNCGQSPQAYSESSEWGANNALKSIQLRKDFCVRCHQGRETDPEPKDILDDEALVAGLWVNPGNHQESILYNALWNGMPKGEPRLSERAIAIFAGWIDDMAIPPAHLVVDQASPFDMGAASIGTDLDHTLTIINTGNQEAREVEYDGLKAPFSILAGGTCSDVIPVGQPCTVIIRYTPSVAEISKDNLEISFLDGRNIDRQILKLEVVATGSTFPVGNLRFLESAKMDFGVVPSSTSKVLSLTLVNTGLGEAESLKLDGMSSPFRRSGGNCGAKVPASSSCNIEIEFAPEVEGPVFQTFTFTYDSGVGPKVLSIPVRGFGAGSAPVYYSQVRDILNRSDCNTCHTGVKGNWGTDYKSLLLFSYPKTTPAIISGDADSRFIKAITTGTSEGFIMGTAGFGQLTNSEVIRIVNWIMFGAPNDPAGQEAVLTISHGPRFDFGVVSTGAYRDQTLTVTNIGGLAAREITGRDFPLGPFNFKGGSYPGTGGSCKSVIEAGAPSCTVVLRFVPNSEGPVSSKLVLDYNNGSSKVRAERDVSGIGVGSPLAKLAYLADANGIFESVIEGDYSSLVLTLTNYGASTATSLSQGTVSGPFVRTGGSCGTFLNQGANCTIALRFSPVNDGSFKSVFALTYNDGSGNRSLNMTLQGQGLPKIESEVTFARINSILSSKCLSCHAPVFGAGITTTYDGLMRFKHSSQATPAINQIEPSSSRMIAAITPGLGTFAGHIMGQTDPETKIAYGSLTPSERQEIIQWILQGAKKASYPYYFKPILGDRYYLTSVLKKTFGQTNSEVNSNTRELLSRADIFGSPCFVNDQVFTSTESKLKTKVIPMPGDICFATNSDEAKLNATTLPESSPISESMRVSACMKIAANTSNPDYNKALAEMGLTPNSVFNANTVTKAYQQFYPGYAPSKEVVDALINIGEESKRKLMTIPASERPREGWRFILLALCASPGWQAP